MTRTAEEAIKQIIALRSYPVPATAKAIQRILTGLGLQDLTAVTSVLFDTTDEVESGGK